MVQFEEKLHANRVSRWADKYIAYSELNAMLSAAKKRRKPPQAPPPRAGEGERQQLVSEDQPVSYAEPDPDSPTAAISARFAEILDAEIVKVEAFYAEKLGSCELQLDLLVSQSPDTSINSVFDGFQSVDEEESMRRAFVDLHRELNFLTNYCVLNYTGFVKILKKHDKNFPEYRLKPNRLPVVESQSFAQAAAALASIERLEAVFSRLFCDSNKAVAHAMLLTKKHAEKNWEQLYLGMKMGMCFVLALWLLWDFLVQNLIIKGTIVELPAGPVYCAAGGLLLLAWSWSACCFVWRSVRINFIYLFELNPKLRHDHYDYVDEATNASLFYLANLLLYLKTLTHKMPEVIPLGLYPLSLLLFVLFKLLFPWHLRAGVLRSLLQTLKAPFAEVTFLTTFIGDVLTSSVKTLTYLAFSVCYVGSGEILAQPRSMDTLCSTNTTYKFVAVPLICASPLWVRFMANIRRFDDTGKRMPNLANAAKYALSMVVVLFGAFHPFAHDAAAATGYQDTWMVVYVVSSFYSWIWDVWMDWGLGSWAHAGLADRLMYRSRRLYYAAIVADFFLRFCWTLTLLPPASHPSFFGRVFPVLMGPLLMALELGRRTFWAFLRVENEHLRNTQGFRRVDVIPLHYDLKPRTAKVKAAKSIVWEAMGVTVAVAALAAGAILVPEGRAL